MLNHLLGKKQGKSVNHGSEKAIHHRGLGPPEKGVSTVVVYTFSSLEESPEILMN